MLYALAGTAAVVLYIAATALLVRALQHGRPPAARPVLALAIGALALHAVLLHGLLIDPSGLDLGFFNALALAGWVIVLLLVLLAVGQPVQNLGLGLYPIAALTVVGALAFSDGRPGPVLSPQPSGIDIHVLVSMGAYGVLCLSAMQAVLLGIQHRLLHDRQPTRALRSLPPLYVMESLLFRLLATGFVLLTAALASGFVYLEDMFAQHLVHKTVLSLVAWVVFAVLLAGRHFAGWRGPTAVRFTLGGVGLLILAYFGSKLVLELILARA